MRRHTVVGLITLCAMLLPAVAGATAPTGITGTVTNASSGANPPIEHLNVCANGKGGGGSCIETSAGGKYTLEVAVGEYEVRFTGEVCVSGSVHGSSCTYEYVEKVVSAVQVTSGNLTEVNGPLLEVDGKISGRATSGGAPVERIEVCAFGSGFGCATTNAGGEYTIEQLPPGSYKVEFSPLTPLSCKGIFCQSLNYISQYWNAALTLETASAVIVKESQITPSINAELQVGGHISGRVTNASIYAEPIASVEVCAQPTRTSKQGKREGTRTCVYTNGAGEYTIGTLASGGYELEFTGEVCVEEKSVKCTHPYLGEIYPGVVSVTAPGTTTGINGSLLEVSPTKPVNTAPPTITAGVSLKAGPEVLTCSAGSWANKPTSLSYRWLRNGVAIAGQTANTYTTQSTDAGTGIVCEVTASNAAGSAASTSNTVQIPKPAPGVAAFKSASIKGSTVSVKLLCPGASACSGVLKLIARVRTGHGRHKKARNVTIGLASFSMALGKSLTLRIHLTGEGRKLLGQAGKREFKVQIAGSGVKAHTTVLKRHR